MGLSVGIVGLPNVGKSTTFNALSGAQNAQAQNYPFCTIEPNKAVVPVPDARLGKLAQIVKPGRIVHSTIEFVDIAGLVRGASKGEGLGNKFLSNIRECEIVLHIVRCFESGDITHVEGCVDPIRDIEIIEIERLGKEAKANQKGAKEALAVANELLAHLNDGKPASNFALKEDESYIALNRELRLLSAKDVIYGANVDEDGIAQDNEYVACVKEYANARGAEVIKLCAKIEEELIGLSDEETHEMLQSLGAQQSGLELIIKRSFAKLSLISYFTAGEMEVRAWTITKGWKAPKAASAIHNDFERGFIRAEVIGYEDYIACGGESRAKEAGKMRLEGKDYVVQDGDVMHFRFNV